MRRIIVATLGGVAALLAGLAVGAMAQTPPAPPPMPMHMQVMARLHGPGICGDRAAFLAGWAAFAQVKLKIAANQEAAWQRFVDAVAAGSKPLEALCPPSGQMPASAARPDALQALDQHQKALTAHLDSVTRLRAAVDQLVSALTAEQRAGLGQALPPMLGPHPMMGHGPAMHQFMHGPPPRP